MVVLLPLMQVVIPPFCGIFFGFLMKIASFDIIPIGDLIDEYGGMTPRDPINANFEAIGFESMYLVTNLGTILIVICSFPILALIYLILKPFQFKCAMYIKAKIAASIFWNSPIKVFEEGFIIIALCCMINLQVLSVQTTGEVISSGTTLFLTVLCFVVPALI